MIQVSPRCACALKLVVSLPIYAWLRMTAHDLTDEQAYKIWLVWGPTDNYPNRAAETWTRDLAVDFVLGPWFPSSSLEALERKLTLADEHELVNWVRRFAASRQTRQTLRG